MGRPIGVIQNSGPLINLLQSLGVNRPPTPFTLDGDVVPVVLIDSAVSFVAAPTPPYAVTDIFTQGPLAAPASGTVLADTGPLPVGQYSVQWVFHNTAVAQFMLQWRDAADATDLWSQTSQIVAGTWWDYQTRLNIVNPNERFRLVAATAAPAGVWQGTILARI